MKIKVDNRTIEFQTLKVQILNKNQENILQKVFEEKTSENYKISLPVESGFLS